MTDHDKAATFSTNDHPRVGIAEKTMHSKPHPRSTPWEFSILAPVSSALRPSTPRRLRRKGSILGTRIQPIQHVLIHLSLASVLNNQRPWHPRIPLSLLIRIYHPQTLPFDFQKLPPMPCLLPHNDDVIYTDTSKRVLTPRRASSICTYNMKRNNQHLLNSDRH